MHGRNPSKCLFVAWVRIHRSTYVHSVLGVGYGVYVHPGVHVPVCLAVSPGKGYTGLALKELMEADIRGELTESPNKVGAASMMLDLADSTYERSRCASLGEEKRDVIPGGGASASPPALGQEDSVPFKPRTEGLGECTLYRHRPDCDTTPPCGDFQLPPEHIQC